MLPSLSPCWLSTIKYQGKGYFTGKSHTFKADLTPPIGAGSAVKPSSFEGHWNTTSKDMRTGAIFTDVTGPKEEVTVEAAEKQGEWESRALWYKVAKGIRESDFEAAAWEKSRIEVLIYPVADGGNMDSFRPRFYQQNEQRQRRRDEAAEGTSWQLKHFIHQEDDPLRRCHLILSLPEPPFLNVSFPDERLGRPFKIVPPTEDVYIYQSNGPTFDSA
jgi:oxysterol-binding protein-related protein 9/10/11